MRVIRGLVNDIRRQKWQVGMAEKEVNGKTLRHGACRMGESSGRIVYILKRKNRYRENEIKPTWRDKQILSRRSCGRVGCRVSGSLKQLAPGGCRFGRCQVVKRRNGCDTRMHTICPATA